MPSDNGKNAALEISVIDAEDKPQTFRLTFADMQRTKVTPDTRAMITAQPEEVGIDYEEMGIKKGSTFAIIYRPFKAGENAEIREAVKDFPPETWLQELHDEICMRCVEEPRFPDTVEGRRQLQRWMPGFRSTVANAVQTQSGMGAHTIKNAKEELSKLAGLTLNTSSN